MNARARLLRRMQRPLAVAAGTVAVVTCAAAACLPSVDFEPPDAGADAAVDAPNVNATQDASDGGVDARADALLEASPIDTGPEAAPARAVMADAIYFGYGQTAACAVRAGTLYCWGDVGANQYGQLGLPDEDAGGAIGIVDPVAVTTTVHSAAQIVQIVMSAYHTCALYGTQPFCWGSDYAQQIGNTTDVNGGPNEFAVVGLPAGGATSMAVSSLSTCALTPMNDAGTVSNVYCWGYNGSGELGRPVEQSGAATAVPVTGDIDGGPLGVIPNAIQLAGGGWHYCVLTTTHEIFCWGATQYFECGPDAGPANCPGGDETTCTAEPMKVTLPSGEVPIEIALGDFHSCALAMSGNVYCWGLNDQNELGAVTLPLDCTFQSMPTPCTGTPTLIGGLTGIQHIYVGGETSCALDGAHHAFCWGDNQFGELATGDEAPYTTPQELLDPTSSNPLTFDDMAMGRFSICALNAGALYCWGSGVLGTEDPIDGGTPDPTHPAPVQF